MFYKRGDGALYKWHGDWKTIMERAEGSTVGYLFIVNTVVISHSSL